MSKTARLWVIFDLETTGVNPARHETIQIARTVLDPVHRDILSTYEFMAYVQPEFWENRNHEAMEVNHISKELLDCMGLTVGDAYGEFCRGIDWSTSVLASWGTDFDIGFLKAMASQAHQIYPFPYQSIDIRTMAHMPRAAMAQTELLSLGEACEYHGVEYDRATAHDALYDAQVTAELALRLLEIAV